MGEKTTVIQELRRPIARWSTVAALALVAAACNPNSEESQPSGMENIPATTAPGGEVTNELGDSQEQAPAQQSNETSIDLSSPASVAWAFAEAKANGDIDTVCKLALCGPDAQLLPGQEIVPFLDDLPIGQPIIEEYSDALIVEIQKKNPDAGKWCIEMGKDTNGNWQVRRYDNPVASDECPVPVPVYEP